MELILRWIAAVAIAFCVGKAVSKLKLPAILGWLIAGMLLGPYAFHLLPDALMDAVWYQNIIHVLECAVGFMIGTELVWRRIKEYGKALIVTTLIQSLGTFALVSGVFGILFMLSDIPVYLAFLFGGIALATAPAPALSIVQEFKTKGDVTKTLIPMAALDDMVGVAVFFTTIAVVARHISGNGMPLYMIPVMILLPLLNFMLMGMAFSATFSNMVTEERLQRIIADFNPLLGVSMIVVILNLGAPLDYHAILGAGIMKGTIAAAAVINEIIAVIVAKKGFEWAGEI